MKKWYQVTCTVRLGIPCLAKDGGGESARATGYVTNAGVCAGNVLQALQAAERIVLGRFEGDKAGNHICEVTIKEVSLEALRDIFTLEESGPDGEPEFRMGLIYFEE